MFSRVYKGILTSLRNSFRASLRALRWLLRHHCKFYEVLYSCRVWQGILQGAYGLEQLEDRDRFKVLGSWGWVARTRLYLFFLTAPKPLRISGLPGTLSDVGPVWGSRVTTSVPDEVQGPMGLTTPNPPTPAPPPNTSNTTNSLGFHRFKALP